MVLLVVDIKNKWL